MKVLTTPRSYGKTDPEVFAMLRAAGLEVEMSRNVQSENTQNLKSMVI